MVDAAVAKALRWRYSDGGLLSEVEIAMICRFGAGVLLNYYFTKQAAVPESQ